MSSGFNNLPKLGSPSRASAAAAKAEESWHGSFRKPKYGIDEPLMTAKSEWARGLRRRKRAEMEFARRHTENWARLQPWLVAKAAEKERKEAEERDRKRKEGIDEEEETELGGVEPPAATRPAKPAGEEERTELGDP